MSGRGTPGNPADSELLAEALHLLKHGECAPGGTETWGDWAAKTEALLRDRMTVADTPGPGAEAIAAGVAAEAKFYDDDEDIKWPLSQVGEQLVRRILAAAWPLLQAEAAASPGAEALLQEHAADCDRSLDAVLICETCANAESRRQAEMEMRGRASHAVRVAARAAAETVLPLLISDLDNTKPLHDPLRLAFRLAADEAVDAAWPLLRAEAAASERERMVLVWRDERGDEICRSTPLSIGATRIAIPLDAFCADLLREPAVDTANTK